MANTESAKKYTIFGINFKRYTQDIGFDGSSSSGLNNKIRPIIEVETKNHLWKIWEPLFWTVAGTGISLIALGTIALLH